MGKRKFVPAPAGCQHCPHCRRTKLQAEFERAERRACGFAERCHECLKEYREGLREMQRINERWRSRPADTSTPPAAVADFLASDIPLDDLG